MPRLAFVPSALSILAVSSAAQTVELSGPFTPPIVGQIESLEFPGNGRVVFYSGGYRSVPLDGSAAPLVIAAGAARFIDFSADGNRAVCMTGGFAFGSLVGTHTDGSAAPLTLDSFAVEGVDNVFPRISPDGEWAAYWVTEEGLELRSARTDGSGAPLVLHAGYTPFFEFNPDSARLHFAGADLFTVPIDGSAAPVNLTTPVGGEIREFRASPDGTRLVFVGTLAPGGAPGLHAVPADGSAAPIDLGGVAYEGGASLSAQSSPFSADGRVVYRADPEDDGTFALYGVPLDGSAAPATLSGTMAANRGVAPAFELTPDGRHVVFLADRHSDEVQELYLASLSGTGNPVRLNTALAGGDVLAFRIAPDSRHVVYLARIGPSGPGELFSVDIGRFRSSAKPRVAKLSAPLAPGRSIVLPFQILEGGGSVLYSTSVSFSAYESFRVPIGGGPVLELTPDLGPDGSAGPVTASPEGFGVFEGIPGPLLGERLFGLPLDASGPPLDLTGPLGFGSAGAVESFQLSADGRQAVYVADEDVPSVRELHVVPTDGSAPALELSGPMPLPEPNPSGVSATRLAPDGTRAAYRARQEGDARIGLYAVTLDGATAPTLLSGAEGDVQPEFAWAGAGERLVYRTSPTSSTTALYSVPADGSAPPVRLDAGTGGNQVFEFALAPDGARTLYLADSLVAAKFELFSIPSDAGGPRVRLHGAVANDRDVTQLALDPSGARVAFVADHGVNEAYDLWSAPLDGSAAAVRLNPAFAAGREVRSFAFSADGQRVVYVADQDVNQRFELYSVPADGSGAAIELNPALVTGGNVGSFLVAGERVLYGADADVDQQVELYAVPIDGSAPAVKLSDLPAPGADVLEFRLAGERALYRQGYFQIAVDLFSVPLDGSEAPRLLSGASATGMVELFALDHTGARVAFSTLEFAAPARLYTAPLDARHAPQALGDFESIEQLAFTADGARVVHRSNAPGEFGSARLFSTRVPRIRSEAR